MDNLFHIFKVSLDEARKIAESPDRVHIHDFEELIVGIEGELEHFIDFKAERLVSPLISFVTKGKVHGVKPFVKQQ
jgi:AraC family transcriptional regulator, transcriptional activator of pobA